MAGEPDDDQYFTLEARLASFSGPQPVAKRRTSTTSSRGKSALSWPHKALRPSALAEAGFYFNPRACNPDNVRCFLCHKELDGWEEDDNPVAEHLKHSPGCGWAITSAVYHEVDKSALSDDPRLGYLVDARKATFAGRWPYESKKGWKCKTKQLVEAGWIWTPSLEADDNTTCVYCHLSLDGWEAGDKPFDEHQRRTPDCPFFDLISKHPAPKNPRGKAARGSKASRASIQSVATITSDAPSASELLADQDDSVLTVTSVATAGGRKTRARKAPASTKGRKTRAKKQEPVEDADELDAEMPPPPPPKATRGKKRGSDEMDDSMLTLHEAPAPKKRTRTRASNAVDDSVLTTTSNDVDMVDAPAPKPAVGAKKKGRVASKGRGRKASAASVASTASTASLRAAVPDDDEIDRQLEADLQQRQDEEQDVQAPAPKAKGGKRTASRKLPAPLKEAPTDYAMFDPAPANDTDSVVDAELHALEQEMSMHHSAKEITIPKKGRKTGTRKASKQTKKQEVQVQEEQQVEPETEQGDDTVVQTVTHTADATQDHDLSIASSTGTVVKGSHNRASTGKRGRGRPPKKSVEPKIAEEPAPEVIEPVTSPVADDDAVDTTAVYHAPSIPGGFPEHVVSPPPAVPTPPVRKALPALPQPQERDSIRAPATPRAKTITHAHSAKQATLSPSQSPQSSDAENRPPSSKPPASSARSALTPRAALSTPVRNKATTATSPSRPANVIGGLKSNVPWTAVDIEMVFADADKENSSGGEVHIPKGDDLTSPEKRMTVEEWIYHTAGQAEKKLKHECEGMVTAFEKEGGRAMRVLEELVVD